MHLRGGRLQLSYCTNIHPANGLEQVFAGLRRYSCALKARLSPHAPFGIGLRLSAAEAEELLPRLGEFREWLEREGLYVALLNGYPYGPFHYQPVKEEVFAPDWRSPDRLRYTLNLVRILDALLPDGMEGGISSIPLSYKAWNADGEAIVSNLVSVAESMIRIRERSGKLLHLDIEPEPGGVLENTADTVDFFTRRLFPAGPLLLADHVRVCFDACHFALAYEQPECALRVLRENGIHIGRIQVSSAIQTLQPHDLAAELSRLNEPVYLHQVVACTTDGRLRHYRDLPDALAAIGKTDEAEWRVHFHVPVSETAFGSLGTTQDWLRSLLEQDLPAHLELETYTWSVLPPEWRPDLVDSLEREYRWTFTAQSRDRQGAVFA